MSVKDVSDLKFALKKFSNGNDPVVLLDKPKTRQEIETLIYEYNKPSFIAVLTSKRELGGSSFLSSTIMSEVPINRVDSLNLLKHQEEGGKISMIPLMVYMLFYSVFLFTKDMSNTSVILVLAFFVSYFIIKGLAYSIEQTLKSRFNACFVYINEEINDHGSLVGCHIKKYFADKYGSAKDFTFHDVVFNYDKILNNILDDEKVNLDDVDKLNNFIIWPTTMVIPSILFVTSMSVTAFLVGIAGMSMYNALVLGPEASGFLIKATALISVSVMYIFYSMQSCYYHVGVITYLGWGARKTARVVGRFFKNN